MWKPIDIKDVVYRGYGETKSPSRLQSGENTIEQKLRECITGWILLLEKEPLTYMGKESPLYNMEMKKPRYGRNMILLK